MYICVGLQSISSFKAYIPNSMRLPHWFKSGEIPLIIRAIIVLVGLYLDRAAHLLRIRNALIILIPQVAALIINNDKRIVDRN